MYDFFSGAITAGYIIVGLFFLRFWRRTGDALFAIFAIAFWLLAANQSLIALTGIDPEYYSWVYLLRFAAFGLIIVAILLKNLPGRRG